MKSDVNYETIRNAFEASSIDFSAKIWKLINRVNEIESSKNSDVTPHPLPHGKTPSQTVKNE